ncbi:MAG: DcrB-related protein [Methanosarcinales archaeon]|nr:DcrB-related protein [Methanosarcinales archaeon]
MHFAESINGPLINNTSAESDGNNYLIYRDDSFNFSFEYPKNWDMIPKNKSNVLFISPNKNEYGYITMNLQILSSTGSGGKYSSIDEVISDLIQQLQENTNNLKINYKKETKLSGLKAKEVNVSYTYNDINYTQTQIIAKNDEYIYVITYFTSLEHYNEHLAEYEHAKSTFVFTYHENGKIHDDQ